MNKMTKSVLFISGVAAVLFLTVLFGYLGLHAKAPSDRMELSYKDTVTVVDGMPEVEHNSVKFKVGDSTKCRIQLKVGDPSENYCFLTLVKIMTPSGKTAAWVSGSSGNWDLEFDIEEKGTYTISSDYYTDAYAFQDACMALDPKSEIKIEEDGSFDGFVFTKEDGSWKVEHEIQITTLK